MKNTRHRSHTTLAIAAPVWSQLRIGQPSGFSGSVAAGREAQTGFIADDKLIDPRQAELQVIDRCICNNACGCTPSLPYCCPHHETKHRDPTHPDQGSVATSCVRAAGRS